MTNNTFPLRDFAMEYGTFLGIAWTLVFLIYVAGFRTGNQLLFLLGFFCLMSLAFLPFIFAFRIKQLQESGSKLNFFQGLLFSFNLFSFACIFTAVCEYAYFCYFDHGMVFNEFSNMLINPEMKAAYHQMGMDDSYSQLKEMTRDLQMLTAFQKTEMLFNSNFIISMILLIPVGFIASLAPSKRRK